MADPKFVPAPCVLQRESITGDPAGVVCCVGGFGLQGLKSGNFPEKDKGGQPCQFLVLISAAGTVVYELVGFKVLGHTPIGVKGYGVLVFLAKAGKKLDVGELDGERARRLGGLPVGPGAGQIEITVTNDQGTPVPQPPVPVDEDDVDSTLFA